MHVAGACDEQHLQSIDRVVQRQLAAPSRWANDGNPGARHDRLFTDRYLWRADEDVQNFVFNSACAQLAGQAMGSDAVRFYFDHLLIKEPGTKAVTPWHQDLPYWPFSGRQVCSVWVALTDASIAGSAMEFVRGSHRTGKVYMPRQFGERKNHPAAWTLAGQGEPVPDIEGDRASYDIVGWDMRRGDAVIFSAWILHSARGNSSADRRRAAISTRWLGDDARWMPHPGADPTVTNEQVRLAPGAAPADDDYFPCVWRRDD